MAPYKVVHAELLGYDPIKLKQSIEGKEKADLPYAIIIPKDFNNLQKAKKLMIDSGLWLI